MAEIRRYEDIMEQALGCMIANQDKITDFNRGSVIHTFLDTLARIAERIYVAIRQGYNENLRMVPCSLFRFERKDGTPASGTVEFARKNPVPGRTAIPKSTRVSGNGKTYLTTAAGYIEDGCLASNSIPAVAEKAGSGYNVPGGTVTSIDSALPSDVSSVTNRDPMTGGTDRESESEFDERFRTHLNGLSGTNDYAIMSAVLGLPSVRSVSLKNHKPPLRNVYNMSVYVDDGSGEASDETLEAARLAVEGDGTSLHQGHLAPGVNVRVVPPLTVQVVFPSVSVDVYRANLGEAELEIKGILAQYVNGLAIGKPVIISEAVSRIKKLPYVYDVKIPQENVDVQNEQIARYGSASLSLREIVNVA